VTSHKMRRRQLLEAVSAAVAAPHVIFSTALGRAGRPPASERIVMGAIGIGGRCLGQQVMHNFLAEPDVQMVAVCDVQSQRREAGQAVVNDTYGNRDCAAYRDLRELLARGDINAVLIATGDRWHALASVMAAKAGKDVYCEKPISLTIREARAMVEAIRRYDRVFQTGLQQRSAPEFSKACDLARSGALGKIHAVYVTHPGTNSEVNLPAEPVPQNLDWDLWLGPAPWRPFNNRFHHYQQPRHVVPWHICRDFGGGNLTSNTVHAFDVVQWGLGMDESGPVEITPPETGQVPALTYKYANGVLVQVVGRLERQKHLVPEGWDVNTPIQSFGAVFVGERGWIHVGRNGYLTSFPAEILDQATAFPDHRYAVTSHQQNWLDCIRSRQRPACDVAIGCRSTIVSHLGCIAHWTGRPLRWDPVAEQFLDDDEANRLRRRAMRPPWRI
jgi:predicted dehydrogenase